MERTRSLLRCRQLCGQPIRRFRGPGWSSSTRQVLVARHERTVWTSEWDETMGGGGDGLASARAPDVAELSRNLDPARLAWRA